MREGAQERRRPGLLVRLLAFLLTAVLVLGALALVVYRDRLNLDAVKRYLAYRSLSLTPAGQSEAFPHAGGERLFFALLEDGAVLASRTGGHYYSFSGDQYAESVLTLDSPVLSASGRAAVVYDAGGQALFVYRDRRESFSLALEGDNELLSARVNDSGWLAVTARQSGYKGAVTVYDAAGEKIIQISLSSTFLMDAALAPDCKTVAAVTIGQEDGAFQSTLLLYPVDATEPSARIPLGDMVVLDMEYESQAVWLLGETQVRCVPLDGTQGVAWPFGQYFLKRCTFGGDGYATLLLGRYRSAPADLLVVLGPEGIPTGQMALRGQTLGLDAKGRYLALLNGEGLSLYTQELELYAALDDTRGARTLAVGRDGSVLLAGDEEAFLYLPG